MRNVVRRLYRRSRFRAALVCLLVAANPAAVAADHPLDPLDADEILTAAFTLLAAGAAQPGAIFQNIELLEPPKSEVLAHQPGAPFGRAASVFFRQGKRSFRTEVDLLAGTFTPPVEIPRKDGQLGLTIQEVIDFGFIFSNARVLAALAQRGLDTPEESASVFVTPLTPGAFGLPEEKRRIVKAQLYFTQGASINLYARPIEGLQVIVDLDEARVVDVRDTGVVPLPPDTADFDEASVDTAVGLRPAMKPIRVTQPEGVNFELDGHFIEWQKWRFHVRFDRRVGAVISTVTYDGRSVLYQGALAEIFVPYQDPDANWLYRTYMDAGEFGVGLLTSPLTPGLDVPENAVLLDAVVAAALPDPDLPVIPLPLERVIGVFERLTGEPAWRHFELFSNAAYEGRAAVELVVRTIAQVGNYDYLFDWVFTQSGVIRVQVGLTGIDAPKTVASTHLSDPGAKEDTHHGALVAPYLVAPHHSHHFSFRLDLDIDGPLNRFVLGKLEEHKVKKSPRRSVWVLEERTLEREKKARLDEDDSVWRVVNAAVTNARGYPVSYVLESDGNVTPLMHRDDYRRARFIEHNLWVTVRHADERFAAGDTPNQNPGEPGLPRYVANDENLVDADIVLWPTLGFHHVTAAEDFPVLSLERRGFELRPANFFDANPALDLRRTPFESGP